MIKGLDQWLTTPPEDDDPVEMAERKIEELEWARRNWETPPGPWGKWLDELKGTIEMLVEYIEENI